MCLGGGYAVRAGAFDPRVRAIAGVGGAYNSPVRLRAALGPEALRERLSLMIGNAEKERAGAERAYLPAVSTEGLAIMPGQEPFDYYGTERSASAVWENRMTMDSWWQLATLDALTPAELLDHTPFLVVHGKVDAFCTPEGAQAVFDRATGPKEIHWIESTNHIDIYDRPELVDPAVERVAEFMARELSPRETVAERFRRALQLRGQPLLDEDDVAFLDDVLGSVEGKAELIARWNARAAEGSSVQADDVVYADGIHVVGVVEVHRRRRAAGAARPTSSTSTSGEGDGRLEPPERRGDRDRARERRAGRRAPERRRVPRGRGGPRAQHVRGRRPRRDQRVPPRGRPLDQRLGRRPREPRRGDGAVQARSTS